MIHQPILIILASVVTSFFCQYCPFNCSPLLRGWFSCPRGWIPLNNIEFTAAWVTCNQEQMEHVVSWLPTNTNLGLTSAISSSSLTTSASTLLHPNEQENSRTVFLKSDAENNLPHLWTKARRKLCSETPLETMSLISVLSNTFLQLYMTVTERCNPSWIFLSLLKFCCCIHLKPKIFQYCQ